MKISAFCGRMHGRHSSRHRKSACYQCGKRGHIQSACKSTISGSPVHSDNTTYSNACHDIETFPLTVDCLNRVALMRLFQQLKTTHDFIVDTGSFESIIPNSNLVKFYHECNVSPSPLTTLGIIRHSIPVVAIHNHYSHF